MNKTILWKNLLGQQRAKQVLGCALQNNALGHAYLFCGDEGTGTVAAALELAMALLCRQSQDAPCYHCDACEKAMHNAHPDLSLVVPLALQKEHRSSDGSLSESGWLYAAQSAAFKIAHPYEPLEYQGIPTIPVEWMKELNHSILRGAVEGGNKVVIVCGIDLMNKEAANAMLKTLEEPPAGTTMILCSQRPHAVLPTIVSRCQIVRFGALSAQQLREQLTLRFGESTDAATLNQAVESAQGSLGQAITLVQNPPVQVIEQCQLIFSLAQHNDWLQAAQELDSLAATSDFGVLEKLFLYSMFFIRNSYLSTIAEAQSCYDINSPLQLDALRGCAPEQIEALVEVCESALSAVRARGNNALVLVTFLMKIMEILHVKKQ
jgi:DNA polymerase-3 subunit delta'